MSALATTALFMVSAMQSGSGPPPAAVNGSTEPRADTLILVGQLDRLDGAEDGGAAEVLWLRTTDLGHFSAGAAFSKIGDAEWLRGKVGVSRLVAPRWRLTTELHAGPGSRRSQGFDYRILTGGAIYTARPRRLYLDLTYQDIDVDRSQGGLLQAGGTWLPRADVSASVTYSTSTGGDLDVDLISSRIDLARGTRGLLAGFAAGSTATVLLGPLGAGPATQNSYRQIFAGVRNTRSGRPLEVLLEYQRAEGLKRLILTAIYRLPLRARAPSR